MKFAARVDDEDELRAMRALDTGKLRGTGTDCSDTMRRDAQGDAGGLTSELDRIGRDALNPGCTMMMFSAVIRIIILYTRV